jgi:hypothetical protein
MTTIRRMAVSMCAAAAGVFIMALSLTAEPAAAARCSEECEEILSTGMAACDAEYPPGTDENADCHLGVDQAYWSCMYNSVTCGTSWYCTVTHFWNYVPQYDCNPY